MLIFDGRKYQFVYTQGAVKAQAEHHLKVERVNPVPTTLQLRLLCNMTAEWHEDFRPFSSQEYQPLVADIPVTYASS
ncbi:hypothetical protein [Nostoc sp.]|uniref:hypothetical protein n=1 Tax=Nostoc sp. TaxID=1180 RepID=UPI002FF9D1F7